MLAGADFSWTLCDALYMCLHVNGDELVGEINGAVVLTATDAALDSGAIGLVVADGRTATNTVTVAPLS